VPVSVPGGNPVTEAAGDIPISPVTWVGPTLLTTGVAPKIPNEQAVPNAIPVGGGGQDAGVVKLHVKLAARLLPKVSATPVVIVALNTVFSARGLVGLKVATLVLATYVTAPATPAPPGAVTVNEELVMVAGFIALLNVALIMAVLGQTPTLPFTGVTDVTVGGVPGEPAADAFCLSGSPHPIVKIRSRNAVNKILFLLCLYIII